MLWWRTRTLKDSHLNTSVPATLSEKEAPNATAGTSVARGAPGAPKREVIRELLSSFNHQPIEFYGRVIDQNGAPVPSAEVKGQVIYNTGMAAGVEKPTTLTDANGYFQFKGLNGRTLDFNIVKAGYQFTPEGDAFDYTRLIAEEKRHHPDPKNPVVVKMWKLQGAESLIQGGRVLNVTPDGAQMRIDFSKGRIVESGGDLIVSLKHDQQTPHASPKQPYDWKAVITAVDGGIIEATQRIDNMLSAPEDGYTPSLVIDMPANRQDWTKTVTKNVYAKTSGTLYSRLVIRVECSPTQPTSYVQVGWWLNPSGSRNLEYDPAKRIEPK